MAAAPDEKVDARPRAEPAHPERLQGSVRLPRLAPHAVVLRRSSSELQVGVEAPLVVPEHYAPLLRALDPDGTAGDLHDLHDLARRSGLAPHAVVEVVDALGEAGLLRRPSAIEQAGVRVVGCGPLGARTAHALADAGVGRLYLADLPGRAHEGADRSYPAARRRPGTTADERRARVELLAAALPLQHPGVRVRRCRHVGEPEGDAVALTVVVADGPEPDRLVVDLLQEQGAPHLLVRWTGAEAVVGPLVVPGTTSCVRCADLARRDADPRWPWLLEQLTRTTLRPDPVLLGWAGVTAAVQVLAYVEGGRAETLGHTLELGRPEHTLRLRAWPVHPECRCRSDAAPPVHRG